VEGIDGSGKSTLVRDLARTLRRGGRSVVVRREPADRELGRRAQRAARDDAWVGGVYFTLDRFLARPGLARDLASHDTVLTDRSFYSTLAYQGSALSAPERRRLAALQRQASIEPDRVVLLDISAEEGLRRIGGRSNDRGPLERLAVLRRVVRSYRSLARARRWVVVDADQSPDRVAEEVRTRLGRRESVRRRR
jgi:dTMP kinase